MLGAPGEPAYRDPLLEYRPAIAPAGAAFYVGPIDSWNGDLFFGTLRGRHLHRVAFSNGETVEKLERLWPARLGRIRAVELGPDGHLYVGTSNRDGRGPRVEQDDGVFRIVPGGSG